MEIWEFIVKYNGNIEKIKELVQAEVEVISEDYAIVTMSKLDIVYLYTLPEVEYIEESKELSMSEVHSPGSEGREPAAGKSELGFAGKGVIVAVLDSGVDYLHPDFRNEDGSSRILCLWDQTDSSGMPPEGFLAGSEYSKEEIDRALQSETPYDLIPENDQIGHGTAVLSVAAGNGRASGGRNRAAAYESDLIVVKLGEKGRESFARTTEMMRAVVYAIRRAQDFTQPVVINISYGTNDGAHNGHSLFETFLAEMADKWKTVIVAAAGNEGSGGHHFHAQMSQGQVADIEFVTVGRISTLFLSLWKNFIDHFTFELIAPNGDRTGVLDEKKPVSVFTLNKTLVNVLFVEPNHYSLGQEVYFKLSPLPGGSIPEGVWVLQVRGVSVVDGIINVWLPTNEQVTEETAFLRPALELTMTLPATAEKLLTVGGYNSVTDGIASFSGRGYICGNLFVKPDLVAPAVDVTAAMPGGGYDTFSGTSFAAPAAAGAAAVLMGWGIAAGNDHFLYGQKIKAYLQLGAIRNDRIQYPNATWGYGKLSLTDSLKYLIEGR